jgi:predicted O-methyltransferase YrrM
LEHYSESKKFWREPYNPPRVPPPSIPEPEQAVLEHVLESAPKEPRKVINSIDEFCEKHWLMHLGSEKVTLLEGALKEVKVKKVLDIGTYFGYSSLWFSLHFDAHVCSLDIS